MVVVAVVVVVVVVVVVAVVVVVVVVVAGRAAVDVGRTARVARHRWQLMPSGGRAAG